MAANSPVVLDSSSPPPAFRHPSITPQKSAEANASSSPGLPELSVFFKGNVPSAPAAAPKTAPALPGFTSAGTLWKAAALEAERKEQEDRSDAAVEDSEIPRKKDSGKLVRPVKKARAEGKTATASRTRRPSVSLSEFDFQPEKTPGQMQPPTDGRKSGKRAVKAKDDDGSVNSQEAGKAKVSKGDVPKARKGTAKTKDTAPIPDVRNNSAVRKHRNPDLAPSPSAQTTALSARPETSRRPSISISENSYEDREPAAAGVGKQMSAYFTLPGSQAPQSPQADAADVTEVEPNGAASASNGPDFKPSVAHPAETEDLHHEESARRPSLSISEYDYRPEAHSAGIQAALPKPEVAQKITKRTSDAGCVPPAGPAKKPKKRFAKSASIIVNSDEPDPTDGDHSHGFNDGNVFVEDVRAETDVPKAKKPSRKAKPRDRAAGEQPTEPGFGVWSQSVYFNPMPVANTIEAGATVESLQTTFETNGGTTAAFDHTSHRIPQPEDRPASPRPNTLFARRRSWTPAKNTYETLDPEVGSSGESPAQRKSLADLVGGFGYDEQVQSVARHPPGEPSLKKRRIEVAEADPNAPRKVTAVKEKVKRVKAPKKKPQTITDLATKAYRIEEEQALNAQSTVSEFFTAQKDDHASATATASGAIREAPPTYKKSRKPRAKKVDSEASTAKKTPKPKKVKVKFNEGAHLPALLSPQQARAKETQQGFLFGTSSQLALEEDVEYVRDLQMAILQSEAVDAVPSSPRRASTKVSVGHAERKLFWSASRDSWGHVIAANGVRRKGAVAISGPAALMQTTRGTIVTPAKSTECDRHGLAEIITRQDSMQDPNQVAPQSEGSQIVDLCATSPITGEEDDQVPSDIATLSANPAASKIVAEPTLPFAAAAAPEDSWMLLESDDSDAGEQLENSLAVSAQHAPIMSFLPVDLPISPEPRAVTPSKRNMTQQRTALTTLDSNVSMLRNTSPAKEQRASISQMSPAALKRAPKIQPNATATISTAAALSPKRRGKPPKNPQTLDEGANLPASQPPNSSDFVAIDDISDLASDDMPLSDIVAAQTAPTSPKRKGRPPKASQQSPIHSSSKNSFVKLDDISDSDAGKKTPSPRRRKAGTVSPVRTLELSPSNLDPSGLPPIADGKTAIKPSDACWLPVSKVLFPQISAVVKSTKPCGEDGELSWWEKILMYDPIVLEDLTAWLVERGVNVKVRRKAIKEKAKKKGRKKKGDLVEEEEQEVVHVEEFEVVKEELRGWMVQKWCEEMSICCLWREGLRGGVKVRY